MHDKRTVCPEIMSLHKQHDEGIELLMTIDDA